MEGGRDGEEGGVMGGEGEGGRRDGWEWQVGGMGGRREGREEG